jgi:hypothetical protein
MVALPRLHRNTAFAHVTAMNKTYTYWNILLTPPVRHREPVAARGDRADHSADVANDGDSSACADPTEPRRPQQADEQRVRPRAAA